MTWIVTSSKRRMRWKNASCCFRSSRAMGYLYHFDWGCKAGVHSGWAIIEAESEQQAHLAVPPLVRHKARVIKLNRFDPAEEHTLHGVSA